MNNQESLYAPPKSVVKDIIYENDRNFVLSSKSQRFFNMLIDTVGYYILAFAIGIVLYLLGILDGEVESSQNGAPWVDWIIGIVVISFYYIPLEYFTGRTLGKVITGTKLVNEHGERPSFMQIVGRTLTRIVPFEPFSFLGSTGRGWHDKWSDTYVIKTRQ